MVINNIMPRYGTREHQRFGLLLLAVLTVAIFMLIPNFAFAAFDGSIVPDSTITNNINSSFSQWWKKFAIWGLWTSLIGLAISVGFLSSKGWQIPFLLAAIFMFGEMIVTGFKNLIG